MTFLPIVERELRVAARRRGTYWTRLAIAVSAIVIGSCILLANFEAAETIVGPYIFTGLSILGLGYCLLAGRRFTVDCLSEEKREGTLGLLFLTDLKGHDVVLGKLAATSVNGFYGLLALFPVLAVPLMMGGISNGQFWRMTLVLVDTFLFSLALGIFASALTREARRAVAANLGMLLLFTLVLPLSAVGLIIMGGGRPGSGVADWGLAYPSPIFAFLFAFDFRYAVQAGDFWSSIAVIHGLSWLLLIWASRIVPRSWQDRIIAPTQETSDPNVQRYGNRGLNTKAGSHRRRLLEVNAFYWLAARDLRKPAMVWLFLGVAAIWSFFSWLQAGSIWFDDYFKILATIILNTTLKLWIALEAGQELAEDKKIGALELLLSTRLTVRDILRGQWLALRRQFLGPMVVVVTVELFFIWTTALQSADYGRNQTLAVVSASLVMLLLDVAALTGVAMYQALVSRNQAQASSLTALRVLVWPWILFGAVAAAVNVVAAVSEKSGPDWRFHLALWFGLGLVADAVYGLRAWRQLRTNFRQLATERFAHAHARQE